MISYVLFRRPVAVLVAISFCLGAVGCAQLKDKLVPKSKKETKPTARYISVKEYDVKPSLDLYTKRYVYWKNWHRDLLDVLQSDNHKKTVIAAEQDVSNLIDMRNMLVDEKAAALQEIIDDMAGIEQQIKMEKVTAGNAVRMRRKLENIGRAVKKDFSYTKVGGSIRSEFAK
ncbi:MAG: hypothetical protein PHH49_06895 [Candidatus Omnitrophica bacterium]|nr:hypothetical protein [Candidatus Omnitrophota bacterium]MDD5488665.1 hypothetical protein [Candidatus Omnitrophota bacterium]